MTHASGVREITEGQAAEELGIDRLELYLVAAEQKLGQYDALTHLLVFADSEVDALATRLGVTRRRQRVSSAATRAAIPEPTGE